MGWEPDRRATSQGLGSRIVVAVCGVLTVIGGYAADRANSGGPPTDVVAIAHDAGARLEREEFSLAPGSLEVGFAVEDASGSAEVEVADRSSSGDTDRYEISAPDTQEVACLAVATAEPQSDEFMAPVEVSTSVTSGPC